MGRLCGGTHEISGIKAPLFLCGWVVGGFLGWVGGGGVGGGGVDGGEVGDGVLSGCAGEGWGGWCCWVMVCLVGGVLGEL